MEAPDDADGSTSAVVAFPLVKAAARGGAGIMRVQGQQDDLVAIRRFELGDGLGGEGCQ